VKTQPSVPNNEVRQIHVVSQVLLRRFVDPATGMLTGYHLASQRDYYPKSPKSVGWVEGFIRHQPRTHEDYWKAEVEDHLHDAFRAVDDRSIFSKPRQIRVLKDCIALHWARSKSYQEVHQMVMALVATRQKQYWAEHRRDLLTAAFYHKRGFYPAGREALELINDELHQLPESIVDGSEFAGRIRGNFHDARQRFDREHLEIAEPPAGCQFLIGDAPVLSFYRQGITGPLPWYRAPLNEASTIVLPIGPQHLAGLGRAERWVSLDVRMVDEMNRCQVLAAKGWVMYQPSSGLSTFVKHVSSVSADS